MNGFDTFLTSLASGLIGVYAGYRLDLGKSAEIRRHDFRTKIRALAVQIEAPSLMNTICSVYRESIPIVKEQCVSVSEDIYRWRKAGFNKYRDAYCAFDAERLNPTPQSDTKEAMASVFKQHQEAKQYLCSTLESLAKSTKWYSVV